MIIGFCGMGHLGRYSNAAAIQKGFKTITYDFGKTGDLAEDLRQCDIVYISPDRPNHHVEPEVLVDVAIRHMNPDAVLVILCQVEPGFTRRVKWPKERLYYQVETLKVNDEAMERALNPERIIIGADNKKDWDGRYMTYIYAFTNRTIIMSYEEAELAKLSINIYLAAQVCVTNTLAAVARDIGANWEYIVPALTSDKRIGKDAYLKPGNGCGPHLERDLKQINKYDVDTSVTESLLRYSETLASSRK